MTAVAARTQHFAEQVDWTEVSRQREVEAMT
jgi:hypothetical protein